MVQDDIEVPANHFRDDEDYRKIFLEVFFSDENKLRADLVDHVGHQNMLLLPLESAPADTAKQLRKNG